MDIKDLQNKSEGELHKILAENRVKLRDLRFQVASEQHKQVHDVKILRNNIAQIMTLLNGGHTIAKSAIKSSTSVPEKTVKQKIESK
jgi:ribosomal protein L29